MFTRILIMVNIELSSYFFFPNEYISSNKSNVTCRENDGILTGVSF